MDAVEQKSEELANEWIQAYMIEIDHVEEFYKKKLEDLISNFI